MSVGFSTVLLAILIAAFAVASGLSSLSQPLFTDVVASRSPRMRAEGQVSFYVSPHGHNMGNKCLVKSAPCLTVQYAHSRAMQDWDFAGYGPVIHVAAGHYQESVVMAGSPVGVHTIDVVGQQSADESCTLTQAEQVIVEAPPGKAAFDIQDSAIRVIRCLTIQGPGTQAFACRQSPASDIAFVKFGHDKSLGEGISANEGCGLNLGGQIWIGNSVTVFLTASLLSRITIGGSVPIIALSQVNMDYFAVASEGAVIQFRDRVSVSGPIKAQWGSKVFRNGVIAGNGIALPGGCSQAIPKEPGACW